MIGRVIDPDLYLVIRYSGDSAPDEEASFGKTTDFLELLSQFQGIHGVAQCGEGHGGAADSTSLLAESTAGLSKSCLLPPLVPLHPERSFDPMGKRASSSNGDGLVRRSLSLLPLVEEREGGDSYESDTT